MGPWMNTDTSGDPRILVMGVLTHAPPPRKILRSFLVQSGDNHAIAIPSGSISIRTAETAEP